MQALILTAFLAEKMGFDDISLSVRISNSRRDGAETMERRARPASRRQPQLIPVCTGKSQGMRQQARTKPNDWSDLFWNVPDRGAKKATQMPRKACRSIDPLHPDSHPQ
jgi:hypothetical protein